MYPDIPPPEFGATELKILETAERLFASDGVASVSARRLIAESGQRNQRAVVYHFGGMNGVIEALLRMRRHAMNVREHAALSAVTASPASPDERPAREREQELEFVLHALLRPTCEIVLETSWGASHTKMLPALMLALDDESRRRMPSSLWSSHAEVLARYDRLFPELPRQVRHERFRLAMAMAANAGSLWATRLLEDPRSQAERRRAPAGFAQMARMIAAGLCASAEVISIRVRSARAERDPTGQSDAAASVRRRAPASRQRR